LQKDARQEGVRMAYMPVEKIFKGSDSIYKITILAARRAVELNNGARKLIDTATSKFSTIALEEIAAGKVHYKLKNQK
jgi:DNA-directed RNA polymerase omega subunit